MLEDIKTILSGAKTVKQNFLENKGECIHSILSTIPLEKLKLQQLLGSEEESIEELKRQFDEKRKNIRNEKVALQYSSHLRDEIFIQEAANPNTSLI